MNSDKPKIVEGDEANFAAEVLQWKRPVLVAFFAPWSRPCQVIRSVVDEAAAACAGRVKFVSINVDDHPDFGVWYDIQSIPTLLCFVNGAVCARMIGTVSKEAVLAKLAPFVTPGSKRESGPPPA